MIIEELPPAVLVRVAELSVLGVTVNVLYLPFTTEYVSGLPAVPVPVTVPNERTA
jgi:hypothetical protein